MRALIADKHDLFRQGLVTILRELSTEEPSILEIANFSGLTSLMADAQFDIVIIGMNIMNEETLDKLSAFRRDHPDVPFLCIIEAPTQQLIDELRSYHLNGIIEKAASQSTYKSAIHSLLLGGNHVPLPIVKRRLPFQMDRHGLFPGTLTRRQEEVLFLLSDGKSNREIAEYLDLSEGTVKVHVTAIFRSLGVKNRTQAMLLAQQHRGDEFSS